MVNSTTQSIPQRTIPPPSPSPSFPSSTISKTKLSTNPQRAIPSPSFLPQQPQISSTLENTTREKSLLKTTTAPPPPQSLIKSAKPHQKSLVNITTQSIPQRTIQPPSPSFPSSTQDNSVFQTLSQSESKTTRQREFSKSTNLSKKDFSTQNITPPA